MTGRWIVPIPTCLVACGLLAMAMAGDARGDPPERPAPSDTTAAGARLRTTPSADAWKSLVGSDRILDAKPGELAGAGSDAVLVVLDPPGSPGARLGEGPRRIVLVFLRDHSGAWRVAARNDRLVPCAQCGGIAGDPYSYATVGPAGFTIITEGGARAHWSNAYSFAWQPAQRTWTLQRVVRRITDRVTSRQASLVLTPDDFGVIDFADTDPAALPQVALSP